MKTKKEVDIPLLQNSVGNLVKKKNKNHTDEDGQKDFFEDDRKILDL